MIKSHKVTFSFGWIRGMKDIADNNRRLKEIRKTHTAEYVDGYDSALCHFDGLCTHGTELGHDLGLVKIYEDFNGQENFKHKENRDA